METWLVALTGKSSRDRARGVSRPKAQDALTTADLQLLRLKMSDAADEYSSTTYTNKAIALVAIRFAQRCQMDFGRWGIYFGLGPNRYNISSL